MADYDWDFSCPSREDRSAALAARVRELEAENQRLKSQLRLIELQKEIANLKKELER